MALVKCPSCHKTVSDVASVCPHCRFATASVQRRRDTGYTMLCHRCGVRIARGAPVCCNCGVQEPHPKISLFKPGMIGVAATLAVVVLSGRMWFSERSHEAPVAEAPGAFVASGVAPPVDPSPAPRRAAPTPPPPALTLPIPQTTLADPRTTVRLWTRTWANVRTARGTEAQVVAVLNPGVPILVSDRRAHWWAVIEDGSLVGYVANSVLTSDPGEVVIESPLASRIP